MTGLLKPLACPLSLSGIPSAFCFSLAPLDKSAIVLSKKDSLGLSEDQAVFHCCFCATEVLKEMFKMCWFRFFFPWKHPESFYLFKYIYLDNQMGRNPAFCQGHLQFSGPSRKKVGEYDDRFTGICAFKMQVTQLFTWCFQRVYPVVPSFLVLVT